MFTGVDDMADQQEEANETSRLLPHVDERYMSRLGSIVQDVINLPSSLTQPNKEEPISGGTAAVEKLAYNDYTTIDWLRDLVSIATLSLVELTGIGQRFDTFSFDPIFQIH